MMKFHPDSLSVDISQITSLKSVPELTTITSSFYLTKIEPTYFLLFMSCLQIIWHLILFLMVINK